MTPDSSTSETPRAEYQHRRAEFVRQAQQLARTDQRLSLTRAVLFAAGVGWRELSSIAPEKEALESVKMLWGLGGFDVNAATSNTGQTALHGAASRGAASIIQFLVDHGAKLNEKDKNGRTPLDEAGPIEEGAGGGNNTVVLAHLNVAVTLLLSLGIGRNMVRADHVTALFGFIDGGLGGNNSYIDGGGNTGFVVYHFLGH